MTLTKNLNTSEGSNKYNTRGPGSNPCNPLMLEGPGSNPCNPFNTKILERLMIFVDGSNLFQGARKHKIKIDFKKLINLLAEDYDIIRVYYYTGIPTKRTSFRKDESEEKFEKRFNKQKSFLDNLSLDLNFDVITKPLSLSGGKVVEKGIDVKIASDIIWHGLSNNYDVFVLISGDKDLMDCLVRMKDNGKRVIVANFEGRVSREMKKLADRYINLSEHINEIKMGLS